MMPKIHPNIGNNIGQTYSVIPNDSNIKYIKKNGPPNTTTIMMATLAQTLSLKWNHWVLFISWSYKGSEGVKVNLSEEPSFKD